MTSVDANGYDDGFSRYYDADGEAEITAGMWEPFCTGLHLLFGGGNERPQSWAKNVWQ